MGFSGFVVTNSSLLKCNKNESPSYMKPFEMISGLVSTKSLMNREDINELLKKSKLIFKISEFSIIGSLFVHFLYHSYH